ncbi:MAG: GGDEF domain-containing protein, partial [Anaerovibrio sp.]|nr:GGDEF domain-containing protein [Anaerovibrio sp.]
ENGEVDAVLLCCRDINNNKSYELELAKKLQSATKDVRRLRKDGLTAVYNRETGQSHIEQEIGQHQKGLFCIIDCDAFKKINDIYGHMAGDAVLVQVANCIKKSLRQSDTIFRLGGDEFVFFARNISSKEMAKLVFERLFSRVNKINAVDLPKHTVRISAGAVLYGGESSTSFEELYQRADKELYLSKKFKGCRVSFAKPIK